jgi:drug/metabolite transporter (DMT)-like permease
VTPFALGLILSAACIHASWNLLAKRAGGGAAFVWAASVAGVAIWLPITIARGEFQQVSWTPVVFLFILGNGVLQTLYFLTLQHGYKVGDLSVVYPLARGTGPLFSTVGAVLFLGERPTPLGLLGAALIVGGVFVIARTAAVTRTEAPPTKGRAATGNLRSGGPAAVDQRQAIAFGVLTGLFIASYTLWDKVAVSQLHLPPVLYDTLSVALRVLFLLPLALRQWPQVVSLWRTHKGEIVGVGFFSELGYILVLVAMQTTPVIYTAPLREVSILLATVMGALLLHEGNLRRRLPAAAAILLGVITLALS